MEILNSTTKFVGELAIYDHTLDVSFEMTIDGAGAIKIEIDRFERTREATFIIKHAEAPGTAFEHFHLRGKSAEGAEFDTESFLITSVRRSFSEREATLAPTGQVEQASLRYTSVTAFDSPQVRWYTTGLTSPPLQAGTPYGLLTFESIAKKNENEVSGRFQVSGDPQTAESWFTDADELLMSVKFAFSFAASTRVQVPLIETIRGAEVKFRFYAQMPFAGKSPMPVIHQADYGTFLNTVISSYSEPHIAVKNLPFAVEWFTMRGDFAESSLIASMTVLENLIDSNLSEGEKRLLDDDQFDDVRKSLSNAVKNQIKDWAMDKCEGAKLLREINERFAELKRHTLRTKLQCLTKAWGVCLDGVDDIAVKAAKKARDLVVHTGHCPSPDKNGFELHDHFLLARELVVRIILTTYGYQGHYCTYVGGYRRTLFPRRVVKVSSVDAGRSG